jgi:hypothetical protein
MNKRCRKLTTAIAVLAIAALPLEVFSGLQKTEAVSVANAEAESSNQPNRVVIEGIEKDGGKKEVAWLGVSVEEAPDSLSAQLGLNAGQGLVITYLVPNSPAVKAGLAKNDLLVEFDDQTLVHPSQLRKLVRMHKEGDSIKLTVYRHGKKETISASLGKTVAGESMLPDKLGMSGHFPGMGPELKEHIHEGIHEHLKNLHESLERAGVDKEKLQIEISRGLEQAHEAIQEALRNLPDPQRDLAPLIKDIERAVRSHVQVNTNASVTVKSRGNSVKTIVKSDDGGTYVIVANPKKRLTVHDKNGKLLFDGEIETPEQQDKVPREVWEKAKSMLEQLDSIQLEQSESEPQKKPSL